MKPDGRKHFKHPKGKFNFRGPKLKDREWWKYLTENLPKSAGRRKAVKQEVELHFDELEQEPDEEVCKGIAEAFKGNGAVVYVTGKRVC